MSSFKSGFTAALLGLAALGTVGMTTEANAHGYVTLGFGLPVYGAPVYAPPPPAYPYYAAPRPYYGVDWRERQEWRQRQEWREREEWRAHHGYDGWHDGYRGYDHR